MKSSGRYPPAAAAGAAGAAAAAAAAGAGCFLLGIRFSFGCPKERISYGTLSLLKQKEMVQAKEMVRPRRTIPATGGSSKSCINDRFYKRF